MPENIYEALWIFLIYAFLGWCAEVAFAAVDKGKFVNRGLRSFGRNTKGASVSLSLNLSVKALCTSVF